jgi:hypothetical protein
VLVGLLLAWRLGDWFLRRRRSALAAAAATGSGQSLSVNL